MVRPSALGDVCRTAPVAVSVKRAMPHAEVAWLVQSGFEPAVAAHPCVDRVISFPRGELGLSKLFRGGGARSRLRSLLRELRPADRESRFDLVLDCQGLLRSGLFARATHARLRFGERGAREGAALCYTHRVETAGIAHTVDRMLAIAAAAGCEPVRDMRLYAGAEDRVAARGLVGGEPYIVFAPTSRWPGKRWPIERFVELARAVLDARGRGGEPVAPRVVVVASAGEREQCAALLDAFAHEPRVLNLVGRTGVGSLLAVIERSVLVVANDSAALHMAVGFDRPLVALFGPTRVGRVGPYGRDADVLQAGRPAAGMSHKDADGGAAMMSKIATVDVIDAVLERLNRRRERRDEPAPESESGRVTDHAAVPDAERVNAGDARAGGTP